MVQNGRIAPLGRVENEGENWRRMGKWTFPPHLYVLGFAFLCVSNCRLAAWWGRGWKMDCWGNPDGPIFSWRHSHWTRKNNKNHRPPSQHPLPSFGPINWLCARELRLYVVRVGGEAHGVLKGRVHYWGTFIHSFRVIPEIASKSAMFCPIQFPPAHVIYSLQSHGMMEKSIFSFFLLELEAQFLDRCWWWLMTTYWNIWVDSPGTPVESVFHIN